MEQRNFILQGQICYSTSPSVLHTDDNSYLVCCGGKSAGVYKEIPEQYKGYPIIDCGQQMIIPGLVDLHIHAPQYGYRATGMDLELLDWLQVITFPEEAKYGQLEYAQSGYEIFVEDMKRSATTRACVFTTIHRESTELLMKMLDETNLKTMVGKVNMDRNSPDILREKDAIEALRDTEQWIRESVERYPNVTPILTPRFIPSCTDELMKGLGELQKKYNLPVQSHLSENRSEIAWVKELCPWAKSYGDAYDSFGLYDTSGRTIMSHCVYLLEEEMRVMKEKDVFIVHCPQSNTNIGSGIAPVRTFLEKGLKLGLGSDVAGGSTLSIFRAIVDTIQVSKLYWRLIDETKKPISLKEAFYMATKGGGEFFGKVGSFEKGYAFDAVVINDESLKSPKKFTLEERLERIVYLGDERNLTKKYVDGVCIF